MLNNLPAKQTFFWSVLPVVEISLLNEEELFKVELTGWL
jgi:hypothetical protein